MFAQAGERPTRFIRVMILPRALIGKSSIQYVNAEDKDKPKSQQYRVFVDAPLTWGLAQALHPECMLLPGALGWIASACTPPASSLASAALIMRWRSIRLFSWKASDTI